MSFLLFALGMFLQTEPVLWLDQEQDSHLLQTRINGQFLDDPLVSKNLKSGLTTTVECLAEFSDSDQECPAGGASIFIRYELWDEVFLLEYWDHAGRHQQVQLDSVQAIQVWLLRTTFQLVKLKGSCWQDEAVRVTIKVLPFSQREQQRAQKWMSRTIAAQQSKPGSNQSNKQVMDLIIGTSVKRPALLEFSWELEPMMGSPDGGQP